MFTCIAAAVLLAAGATNKPRKKTFCAPADDAGDCAGLHAFAMATGYESWTKNTHWGSGKSICSDWHGVTCGDVYNVETGKKSSRVTGIDLKANNLIGSVPSEFALLTELTTLDLDGGRPADYYGCGGNNFQNSTLPAAFFSMSKLSDVNLEYTCSAGTLDGFGSMTQMTSLQIHGNYFNGTVPKSLGNLKKVTILKLGRNPLTGTLPVFALPKVIQFNCNFCALTGAFPDDFFDLMPSIQISYWDGNGFTGTLPSSIARAKTLTRVSFNLNQFSGKIPPGICNTPAGDGPNTPDVAHDCRIGADTDYAVYQANYPWIIKGNGNMYDCPVPACAVQGSCNKTAGKAVVNPLSPVRCKN